MDNLVDVDCWFANIFGDWSCGKEVSCFISGGSVTWTWESMGGRKWVVSVPAVVITSHSSVEKGLDYPIQVENMRYFGRLMKKKWRIRNLRKHKSHISTQRIEPRPASKFVPKPAQAESEFLFSPWHMSRDYYNTNINYDPASESLYPDSSTTISLAWEPKSSTRPTNAKE